MFENRYKLDKTAYMAARLINPMYRAEFCHLSENAVYIAYNEKQPLYTIRISRTDYRTKSNLEGEINWLCMLKNLPVTTPVKVKGRYINCINGYFVVVFKYIVGNMPDYNNCDIMYQCGKIAAMLHKSPKPHNADRPVWSVENMTGIDGLWGNWRDNENLSNEEKKLIQNILEENIVKIKNYKSDKYGLIHFDLRITNLIKGDKIYAIDFDDCGYGYYIQDLASALSFMEHCCDIEKMKEAWYKGYEKISSLEYEDKQIADSFIILRRIQLLAWITSHKESYYVKTIRRDFEKNTIDFLRRFI